jgi:hypothetical protein
MGTMVNPLRKVQSAKARSTSDAPPSACGGILSPICQLDIGESDAGLVCFLADRFLVGVANGLVISPTGSSVCKGETRLLPMLRLKECACLLLVYIRCVM